MITRFSPAAAQVTVTFPVRVPPCEGVSVTTQLAPAPSEAGQVFVSEKSPLAVIPEIARAAPVEFVSVMVCVLGTPTSVPLLKTMLAGLALSAGFTVSTVITDVVPADAVMVTAVTLLTPPAVTVKV